MSWLNPNNISPSDYDPKKRVEAVLEKLGPLSSDILSAFNEIDPLGVLGTDNVDEYVGYIEHFFKQLGDRDFKTLTNQEVTELAEALFTETQKKVFVKPGRLDELTQRMVSLREQP